MVRIFKELSIGLYILYACVKVFFFLFFFKKSLATFEHLLCCFMTVACCYTCSGYCVISKSDPEATLSRSPETPLHACSQTE